MRTLIDAFDVTACLVGYVLLMCIICFVFGKVGELFKKGDPQMLSIKKFENALLEELNKSGCKIGVQSVLKSGDKYRRGITVDRGDDSAVPVTYIDDLYDLYKSGMSMESMAKTILNLKAPEIKIDMEVLKNNLTYRPLSIKNNEKLLENIPYKKFFDIAICLEARVFEDSGGYMATVVNDSIFEPEMWDIAAITAPTVSPATMTALSNRLAGLEDNILITGQFDEEPLYVLTNESGIHGASVLFYDGIKERIYDLFGSYYAIPSSINEWLISPVKNGTDAEKDFLRGCLLEANSTVVSYEEILSDTLYVYDGKEFKVA